MRLQSGLPWVSQLGWPSELALAYCRLRLLRYQPCPNHTHCWADPHRRMLSKRYGQLSYSKHRGYP